MLMFPVYTVCIQRDISRGLMDMVGLLYSNILMEVVAF